MEMGDIDHTNPHTDEPFVETFRRGQDDEEGTIEGVEPETMEDVVHEAPTDGAKRTFERGNEGRDETV
ncbi:hypothetical protein BRD09_01345 [Halobacteriales archaeon SW_10_68_16]|nr:MAG: hypothetical protein BRD09_01345 [Halobacteriales archaeon SW_10_68_16]